jgi:phosphoserine phosphatase
LGKRQQVQEITDAAMRGEIDFEQSLRQRVSLLEGVEEADLLRISENFVINDGAAELIEHVHSLGGKACAVSGGFASLLKPIASELELDAYLANQLEMLKGVLTGGLIPPIIDAEAKRAALLEWAQRFSIPMEKTVAIGDGANDLLMMEAAALSIGFMPKPIVAKSCDYILETADFRPVIDLLP